MRGWGLTFAVFSLFCQVAVASAQIVNPLPPIGPPQQMADLLDRAAQNAKSAIHGAAVDSARHPLPNATVRLRNLQTNRIEQVSTANQVGEFSFVTKADVPYVVEVADQAGQIVAVGDVVVAQAGEVAGAMVAIPSRLPSLAGVFSQASGSVLSAATSIGFNAFAAASTALPVISPER